MTDEEYTPLSLDDLPEGEESSDVKPLLYTNFSLESRVRTVGGKVYGNWTQSFAGACSNAFEASIPKDAIQSMVRVGNCPNGGAVVKVENY